MGLKEDRQSLRLVKAEKEAERSRAVRLEGSPCGCGPFLLLLSAFPGQLWTCFLHGHMLSLFFWPHWGFFANSLRPRVPCSQRVGESCANTCSRPLPSASFCPWETSEEPTVTLVRGLRFLLPTSLFCCPFPLRGVPSYPLRIGICCLPPQKGKLALHREKGKFSYSKPVFTIITCTSKSN